MKRRLLLLSPLPVFAQTKPQQSAPIYRCGNQLSDRPCEGDAQGSAKRFDEPSKADREAAAARAKADAREAEALAKERRRREAQPAPAPARLDAARPPEPPASKPADRVAGRVPKKKSKPKKD